MKMKKLVLLLTACVLGLSLSACSSSSSDESAPLRVAVMPAASGATVQYAYENGYFDEVGLDIEISIFSTGTPINEAIAAGELDVAAIGSAGIFSLANGQCQLILETNTADGVAIYAHPDSEILSAQGELAIDPSVYGSTDLLTGKTIIAPLGTTQQLMADAYAECFGVVGDLTLVNMEAGPGYQAFTAGEADLLATFPPYSLQAEAAGMVEVAKFENISGYSLTDLLIATNDIIDTRSDDIQKFTEAVLKANVALEDDALRSEFSIAWFAENAREYSEQDMLDEMAVRRYYNEDMITDPDYYMGMSLIELGVFYVDNGTIDSDNYPNIAASINTSFAENYYGATVNAAS